MYDNDLLVNIDFQQLSSVPVFGVYDNPALERVSIPSLSHVEADLAVLSKYE